MVEGLGGEIELERLGVLPGLGQQGAIELIVGLVEAGDALRLDPDRRRILAADLPLVEALNHELAGASSR